MLVKIVFLFLLAMLLVAMIGRAVFPGRLRRVARNRLPATCPHCGSFIIGKGPCTCSRAKRKA